MIGKIEGFLSISDSIKYLQEKGMIISDQTLRNWAGKYQIGRKIVNTWFIDKNCLDKLINGEVNYFDKFIEKGGKS